MEYTLLYMYEHHKKYKKLCGGGGGGGGGGTKIDIATYEHNIL